MLVQREKVFIPRVRGDAHGVHIAAVADQVFRASAESGVDLLQTRKLDHGTGTVQRRRDTVGLIL